MTSLAEAQQLFRAGRLPEAERAFEQVLQQSPDELEALNVVAMAALRNRQLDRALGLLEHAARVHPEDPLTQHHLGRVRQAGGDLDGAAQAYAFAARLKPDFFLARAHLGVVLERKGDNHGALVQYARALSDAQKQDRWTNAESTPPGLRPMVEHAVTTVRSGQRGLYARLLEPIAKRYGPDSLRRVERCLRIYFREEQVARPDPRQQPSFLYFPDLPTAPYVDTAAFPWIPALEAQTAAIREELMRLLPSEQGRERVFTSEELEKQNLRGLDSPPSWTGYYFYRHGERRADNCASCPRTAEALSAVPLARVPGHAPEVLFSVFTPGTHLLPHRGVTNTRLVAHLPLIVPDNCALSVGGEVHHWREGRVVVFDDTYEHEAWNRSGKTRVVLIFDVWNPYLIEAERAAVALLVAGIGEFRASVERA